GFDWEHVDDVWAKVHEEIDELKEADKSGDPERFTDELGDLLFALVNLSRFEEVWAELALEQTIGKFGRRFRHIEEVARREKRELSSMTLAEMDAAWEQAKSQEA
ncbi:MazG nucleotide pyrophosphohydrolase domain-containing protein, partial [Candidatus Sumerlaeota bacterium]